MQAAKQKGSLDNISVVVVFLRDPSLIARRPLPPAPQSPQPVSQATPTMEEQRKEFEELTAKWGWNEPNGGAVFNELPWQDQHDQRQQDQQQADDACALPDAFNGSSLHFGVHSDGDASPDENWVKHATPTVAEAQRPKINRASCFSFVLVGCSKTTSPSTWRPSGTLTTLMVSRTRSGDGQMALALRAPPCRKKTCRSRMEE